MLQLHSITILIISIHVTRIFWRSTVLRVSPGLYLGYFTRQLIFLKQKHLQPDAFNVSGHPLLCLTLHTEVYYSQITTVEFSSTVFKYV